MDLLKVTAKVACLVLGVDGLVEAVEGAVLLIKAVNAQGTASSMATITDANTTQVEWFDKNLKKLGLTMVPVVGLTKVDPASFLQTGDVVKANDDISKSGKSVCKKGDLGTLKGRNGDGRWNVSWGEGGGKARKVSEQYFTKCDPAEYIMAGDIVKANTDFYWPWPKNARVGKGTMGTVKEFQKSDNTLLVSWEGIGDLHVDKDAVTKLVPNEYKLVGDFVKATCVIRWPTGKSVSEGTVGTLKDHRARDGAWLVQWGENIGELYVVDHALKKCDPMEIWRTGDVLETTKELTCASVTIPIGSTCKIVA